MSDNSELIKLFVAIYDQGVFFKHWSLFIQDESDLIILQATGSDRHFKFEEKSSDARDSKTIKHLVELADIQKHGIARLKHLASTLPLNTSHGWNCQSFVIELVEKAGRQGLITVDPKITEAVLGMQDGFD